jgi:uncharacterized membrane protein
MSEIMKMLRNALLKGVVAVLPIGLTLYFVYWLAVTLERLLGSIFKAMLPDNLYHPGMGLLFGVILLIAAGIAVNAWVVHVLLSLSGQLLERIPLVKSVYSAVRDFVDFFAADRKDSESQRVVMVSYGDMRLIGFLTREQVPELQSIGEQDRIAVYVPMSYQIGGFTLFVPRDSVQPIDINAEDAMRLVLTAGLGKQQSSLVDEPDQGADPRDSDAGIKQGL